jgi:Fic family protein
MKLSDLSADRRRSVVDVEGRPGVVALVPAPLPRQVSVANVLLPLEQAISALAMLRLTADGFPLARSAEFVLGRGEAIASAHFAHEDCDLVSLLAYEASEEEEPPAAKLRQAVNCIKALQFGMGQTSGGFAVTLSFLRDAHRIATGSAAVNGIPGELRSRQTWIGGHRIEVARFVPPPASRLEQCLADVEEFVAAPKSMPLILQIALLVAQVEGIAPFEFGNGIVSRLIPSLMSAGAGYPPLFMSGFLYENRQEYEEAIAAVHLRNDWDRWLSFFLDGVAAAANHTISTIQAMARLHAKWEGKLSFLRSDSRARDVAGLAFGNPVMTVGGIQRQLGVSFQTANSAVVALGKIGILSSFNGNRRGRVFVADDMLQLLGSERKQEASLVTA